MREAGRGEVTDRRARAIDGEAPDEPFVRALLANDCDWHWESDVSHRVTYLSETYQQSTGIDPARVIGRSRLDALLSSGRQDREERAHREALASAQAFRDFVYEVGEGANRRWLSISGIPKFDQQGTFAGYRGTGRNVTGLVTLLHDTSSGAFARREHELAAATQQAEMLLQDLKRSLDAMDMGLVILDANLEIEIVNKAFFDIWKVSPENISVGNPFRSLMDINRHNGVYAVSDAEWEAYVSERTAEIRNGDVAPREFARADGRTMIYSVTALTGGKRLVSYYDITTLKERETESRSARNYLAAVLESLPAGIIIYDSEDKFVLANRQLQETLPGLVPVMSKGCPFEDSVRLGHSLGYFRTCGDPAIDALYDSDFDAWFEAYLARHRLPYTTFERQNPDGRWYQAIDTRMPDGSFIGIRMEITELKQREAELQEAQRKAVLADRAKSEFLANMSHEIRTPMNGVLGMAELLARSELDERQKTFTDIIVKSGNALLTIINDILDFSKIDAGQLMLDPAPFNLAEAIEDVATLVSTRAKEKDLELIARVQPGLHDHYVGDVGRIRQIITNLLGNAVKFTEAGHVLIDVTGREDGDVTLLHVSVTDTGIGIPQDKLQHVFDKFSQVDASSTRRHEGTGLGLAITSRLVAMMDGEIGVTSKEGEGSTFWFTIRLPRAAPTVEARTTPIDVSGSRILIIDDNAVNRAILLEQMQNWGFDACAAASGPEGIAVLKAVAAHELSVDCVILDFQMPQMSGAEVARIVRTTAEIAETPIVMLTSVDQALGQLGYRSLNIDAQLIKPARSAALLEAIVSTIQRRRASVGSVSADVLPGPAPTHSERPTRRELRIVGQQSQSTARVDILVAEDNEVNQLVFTQILGETGLNYEIVGNGRLAVEAYRTMKPGMVLMDVSMPEMNGLEATAKIREMEKLSGTHVPIIGVTAHALKGDRERCLEAGMDDYLSKPISPDALTRKIKLWVQGNASDDAAKAL